MLVKDINPGAAGSFNSSPFDLNFDLTNVNGTLFFSADDGTVGSELWAFNTEHTEQAPIPTVSEWGTVLMAVLVLIAGTVVLRRKVAARKV